jgi:outer membrane immunogenic protein
MKIFSAAAALLVVASGPAMAADMARRAAPAPVYTKAPMMPVYSWTGGYIGVNAGYSWGDSEVSTGTVFSALPFPLGYFQPTSVPAIAAAGAQTVKPNGFTGGGQIGYNWQASSVTVVGLEADFEFYGLKGSATSGAVYPCCAPTGFVINQNFKTDWLATFRARLGYLVTPSTLFYVTGGGAVTNLQGTFVFTDNNSSAAESASFNTAKLGWTVGGGVEWAMWSGWSAKAEYLFVSFPTVTVTSTNLTTIFGASPANVFTHTADLDAHIVRLGLNYKFGGPVVAKY